MKFGLRVPCIDCPFRAEGAIELRPGRLAGIVESLRSDFTCFPCHQYLGAPKVRVQACLGALAYMQQHYGQTPILYRLAVRDGEITHEVLLTVRPLLLRT